jgi:hypothetical protein
MEQTMYSRSPRFDMDSSVMLGAFAASWPTVIAGAFVAIVASLVLLKLGQSLGFASISAWADQSVSGTTAMSTAIWVIATQWISVGLGGYITGRLRTRRYGTPASENRLRDNVHGLLTWVIATVAVATLVGASAQSMYAGAAYGAPATAQSMVSSLSSPITSRPTDTLLRYANSANSGKLTSYQRIRADNILGNTLAMGSLPIVDPTLLPGMSGAKGGVSGGDAQRPADYRLPGRLGAGAMPPDEGDAAQAAIYTAISLLTGAFVASGAAVLGGRRRDEGP